MKLGMTTNEYGTTVAEYRCEYCGGTFTVCPPPEDDDAWKGCMAPLCGSYDPSRDADKLFDAGGIGIVRDEVTAARQ